MDDYLFLVNRSHPLPDGYDPAIVSVPGFKFIYADVGCVNMLCKMLKDCRASGASPYIRDGFRSREQQRSIFVSKVTMLIKAGYSGQAAVAEANKSVALPRQSEHETGLAFDINDISEHTDNAINSTYLWLRDNCWRYGFILRYPENKSSITGYSFEPWHFRYVGLPHAEIITKKGLCLEEYHKILFSL